MRMRVFLPNDFDVRDFEHLGYSVIAVDRWKEMKEVLKPEAYDTWVWVTLEKSIGIASKSVHVKQKRLYTIVIQCLFSNRK